MIEKRTHDFLLKNIRFNLKRGAAILLSLVLVLSVMCFDMPVASANPDTSGVDPYEYLKSFLHTIDNSYSRNYEDSFDTMYNDYDCKYLLISVGESLTEFLMFNYEPVSIDSPYSYLSFFRFDIDEITNSGVQAIAVCGQIWNGSGEGYMVRANADTFYMNGFNKTTRSLLAGTQSAMTPYNSSSTNTSFNNFFGRQLLDYNSSYYTFYHNYDLYIESLNTTYPATYSAPLDNGNLYLSTTTRDNKSYLQITPKSSVLEYQTYTSWSIDVTTQSDLGETVYSYTISPVIPNWHDDYSLYFNAVGNDTIPGYILVSFSELCPSKCTYCYVSSVHLVGAGDVDFNEWYFTPYFALIGDIPSDAYDDDYGVDGTADTFYNNRGDDVETVTNTDYTYSYIASYTSNGTVSADSSSFWSITPEDIGAVSWANALLLLEDGTVLGFGITSPYAGLNGFAARSRMWWSPDPNSSNFRKMELSVGTDTSTKGPYSEIALANYYAPFYDVIIITYDMTLTSASDLSFTYSYNVYFTSSYAKQAQDRIVVDALTNNSSQLYNLTTSVLNEYYVLDNMFGYLKYRLDDFETQSVNYYGTMTDKITSSNTLLSSISRSVSGIDSSITSVDNKLSDVLTAFSAINSVNTGIGQKIDTLNSNLLNGVTAIVDAINDISITGGGGSGSDYSDVLNRILNAVQYKQATGTLPYHDYYTDNSASFIDGMNYFFGSLGFSNDGDSFDVADTSSSIFSVFEIFLGLFDFDSNLNSLEGSDGELDISTTLVNPFSNYFSDSWDADIVSPLGGSFLITPTGGVE